jgi:hypothetical protein
MHGNRLRREHAKHCDDRALAFSGREGLEQGVEALSVRTNELCLRYTGCEKGDDLLP